MGQLGARRNRRTIARHRRNRKTNLHHGGTETRRHGEKPKMMELLCRQRLFLDSRVRVIRGQDSDPRLSAQIRGKSREADFAR